MWELLVVARVSEVFFFVIVFICIIVYGLFSSIMEVNVEKIKLLSLRITDKLYQRVKDISVDDDRNISSCVRRAIDEYVENYERVHNFSKRREIENAKGCRGIE